MMPLRRTLPGVIALLLAAAPAAASAAAPWATVNICDTVDHPDTIGIRASMPGSGNPGEDMFMRFQLQLQEADGSWRLLGAGADSGYVDVGRATARAPRQAGHSFQLSPPPSGGLYTLRGLVTFEWRAADGTVDRRERRRTSGGHRSTAGADPAGFTAALCTISA